MSINLVNDLKHLAGQRGLTVTLVSNGHFKVSGYEDVVVNYWPGSKNRTAHVEGTSAGVKGCSPLDVIKLATSLPKIGTLDPDHKAKRVNRIKDRMDAETIAAASSESTSTPPWKE